MKIMRGYAFWLVAVLSFMGVIVMRNKHRIALVIADGTWVTIAVSGSMRWLNENIGAWSFILGAIGLGVSAWFKWAAVRELRKAREQGLPISAPVGD